ncbi:MAG: PKD domain-containing protein [Bacteroidetes bacterium]|nr:PKD domain-containing protein [Bacteroidota bacterium]
MTHKLTANNILKRAFLLIFFCIGISCFLSAQEICNNGIDDDGDLLIDLNDSVECFCSIEKKYEFIPSLIPNPSFEEMDSCTDAFAQVDRSKGWRQATDATSDLYNMTCPWHGFLNHQPVPDGNAFVGCGFLSTWQEYVGACLTEPMRSGTEYELKFNIAGFATTFGADTIWKKIKFLPVDVTLFGTTSCPNFPLTNVTPQNPTAYFLECPAEKGWKEIGKVKYDYDTLWKELTMTITPTEDIYSVMLGPPCKVETFRSDNSDENGILYVLFDNLILNKTSTFKASQSIQSSGTLCKNLELLGHSSFSGGTRQWYKNGIALIGETDSIIKVSAKNYGSGKYTFIINIDSVKHNCFTSSIVVDPPVYSAIKPFFVDDKDFCPQHTATFTSTNITATSCKWFFGDGDSSSVCNPTHLYKNSGLYNVKLSITNEFGCVTDSIATAMINVFDLPIINYNIDDRDGCAPHIATFTNNSTLSSSCTWDFGDGSPSTNNCNPSHTYAATGAYTGNLTVTSPNGCISDSTIETINVYPYPAINYSVSSENTCTNTPFTFTNNSTLANSCLWDFGDGTSSSNCAPTHVYSSAGNFTVKLSVTSAKGCVNDTSSRKLSINAYPKASFDSIAPGCSPFAITFQNTSTKASTYSWSFSSGNTAFSNDANPSVQLTNNSDTNALTKVELIANNNGCRDTTFQQILVYSAPVAEFSFSPSKYFLPNTVPVIFKNESSNSTSYLWSFGDGIGSAINNPLHTYSSTGTFPITLIVTNAYGCPDTLEKNIVVKEHGSIEFPTAFIPNKEVANGGKYDVTNIKNDVFFPKYESISKYHLMIFNHWGELLFESNDVNIGWDGYYKETLCQPDVYVWKTEVVFEDRDGEVYQASGSITLLR